MSKYTWPIGAALMASAAFCMSGPVALAQEAEEAPAQESLAIGDEQPSAAPVEAAPSVPDKVDPFTIVRQLAPGWNIGNSLEAVSDAERPVTKSQEDAWGNPPVTQDLLNAVRDAGFKSVRIPVSWDQYTDAEGRISPKWIERVREVIGYARNAGLYVIVNEHWDSGWQQPNYASRDMANAKLASLWTQIATALEDQDDHVFFAGTNEVMVKDDYSTPTPEYCEVQSGFNQVFVNAVRATGGSNASRWLVVQGFNTDINNTLLCNAELPQDSTPNRLMMEVHYYDPYNYTLNTDNELWQWGQISTDPKAKEDWADEDHADAQFGKIKAAFVDKGVPVILGEYAASLRSEFDTKQTYRNYWDLYVTYSATRHGLVPVYWDNGYITNHNTGLFNRGRAKLAYPATAAVITEGVKAGLDKLGLDEAEADRAQPAD